jgi:ankyrin repeat protein
MAPLHVAVAHRQLAVVAALLAAGADANLQSEYGNAPHFAALDRVQRVMPCARQIEDKNHWQILRTLLDAGADVNATSRRGATVMDLAIATVPYPREPLRFLVARSARGDLDGSSLGGLLDGLPAYSLRHLQVRVNKVRFLLEAGADPNQLHSSRFGREEKTALSLLFDSVGYKEDSVPGEIFLELVEELLRHGARDVPSSDGRTALDRAERWLEYGYENYRLAVERLREVASPSGR